MSRSNSSLLKKLFPLLVLMLLLIPMESRAAEYFEVREMDVEVSVGEDNAYEVRETITVEFSEPRHGIFRTIPLSYDGRQAKISGIDTAGRTMKTSRSSGNLVIQIGDADLFVDGLQTYEISYVYALPVDRYEEYDEFYYNLVGNQWPVPMDRVRFSVEMPKDFDANKMDFFTGAYGSQNQEGLSYGVNGRVVSGETTRVLLPGEAVTMRIELPEGYFEESFFAKTVNFFFGYAYLFFGGLFLILGFMTWRKYGRDERLFVAPEFYPPEDMTPAEVGYIIDSTMDNKDVTALLIYWASRGYMTIEEVGRKNLRFHKLKDADDTFKSFEKIMFNNLFDVYGTDGRVETEDLKYVFASTINAVKSEISDGLTKYAEKPLYTQRSKNLGRLFKFLAILPLYFMVMKHLNLIFGAGPMVLLMALIPTLAMYAPIAVFIEGFKKRYVISRGSMVRKALMLVFIAIFVSIIGFGLYSVVKAYGVKSTLMPFLTAIVASTGIYILGAVMRQKTDYGKKVLEKILGLKLFITTAEKPKLEMLFDENPSYFYDVLAYAVVLGVTKKWAKKFDDILTEPPSWYEGRSGGSFRTMVFVSAMNRNLNVAASSMVSVKSSGGIGGGGGFSGGGAGGGGGGSW